MSQSFDKGSRLSKAFLQDKDNRERAAVPLSRSLSNQLNNDHHWIEGENDRRRHKYEQATAQKNGPQIFTYTASKKNSAQKQLSGCCYTLANLFLIIGSIVAIIILIKFIIDDALYDYGEYILSWVFYRQLIYALVVMPLVLFVPMFNAFSACFTGSPSYKQTPINSSTTNNTIVNDHRETREQHLSRTTSANNVGHHKHEQRQSLLLIKIFFQILLIILLFIAIIFVAPYISSYRLSDQIELELRKHMKLRYEHEFSYKLMEAIQTKYGCCDEAWYAANLHSNLPVSCYADPPHYTQIYAETCSYVLGSLIGNQSAILAACIVILLISLAILVAIDIFHWLHLKTQRIDRRSYEFVPPDGRKANQTLGSKIVFTDQNNSSDDEADDRADLSSNKTSSMIEEDSTLLEPDELIERLKLNDRDRQELISSSPVVSMEQTRPIRETEPKVLTSSRSRLTKVPIKETDFGEVSESPRGNPLEDHRASPTILTRANYVTVRRERSQSPAYLDSLDEEETTTTTTTIKMDNGASEKPIKGVLKKTSSFQKIDDDQETSRATTPGWDNKEDDSEQLQDYADKLRKNATTLLRQHQTRRSLLNVRFAN